MSGIAATCLPRFVRQRLTDRVRPLAEAERESLDAAVLFADLSGFTALAESLALKGSEGAEALAALLNESIGALTETIVAHGGDLAKFVGDAVIALWPAEPGKLAGAIHRAERCAREAAARLDARRPGELRLHAGIGAGPISTILAGGHADRWYSTVAGAALRQAGLASQNAGRGEVVLSAEAVAIAQGGVGAAGEPDSANLAPATSEALPRMKAFLPEALIAGIDAGQLGWLAELRPVTAIFVGLDEIRADAADVLARVQQTMAEAQPLFARFGGLLKEITFDDKGCTLVAIFGAPPLAHEDNEVRALRSAVELHETLARRGARTSIGIASGRALCGLVGSAARREYTVVGSTMNRAARLMQAAGGEVVCDERSRQAARAAMNFESFGSILVKGVAQPLEVYRPVGRAARREVGGPLIGRVRERAAIARSLDELAAEGAAATGIVTIEGSPGIGKSKLLHELRAQAAGMAVIECCGDAVEHLLPYAAWRSSLRRLFGAEPAESADALRQRVLASVAGDAADLRLAPLLGPVLAIEIPDNDDTAAMDGAVRAENTRALLVRIIDRLAGLPRVVVVEDAHWLDSASWQLIRALAASDGPQLFAIALRSATEPTTEAAAIFDDPRTVRLRLGELDPEQTRRLLAASVGAETVQDAVAEFVVKRTGGQPLFVEHLAQAMIGSGLIEIDGGECRQRRGASDLAQAAFPDTVQGVVRAGIDRLQPSVQLTLKAASTIGVEFPWSVLAAIHPAPVDLARDIEALLAHGLIAESADTTERLFEFRQALTQQVAYELLLFAQRRELHRAIAESIEASADEAANPARLAHHYASALDPAAPDPHVVDKLAQHAAAAGTTALRAGSYREATRLLSETIRWLESPYARAREPFRLACLQRQLGDALSGLGDLAAARQRHEQALCLLGRRVQRSLPSTAASLMAASARQFAHRLRKGDWVTAPDSPGKLEAVRAYERLAEIDFFDNQPIDSLRWSILGLNEAEDAGPSPELVRISASMAVTAGLMGLHKLARIYERQSETICATAAELASEAWARMAKSLYRVGIGDWQVADRAIDEARALYQRIGHRRYWEASSYVKLMVLAHHHGRAEESSRLAAEVEASGASSGNVQAESWGLIGFAENALRQRRPAIALPALQRAAALIPQGIGRAEELRVHALLAWAWLAHGEREQAAVQLREAAMRIRGTAPTTYYSIEAYAAAARVALALADGTREHEALAAEALKALRGFARTFPIAQPRAHLIEGLRLWRKGAAARAEQAWRQSASAAARLAMPYEEALAHATLGAHLEGEVGERHRRQGQQGFAQLGIEAASSGAWAYCHD